MSTTTIDLPLVNVLVPKGSEQLSVALPEHEVRVIKVMHPQGGVIVSEDTDPVLETFDVDAGAELARLLRKYQRINANNPVNAVFREPDDLVKFGFKLTGKTVEEAPKSDVQDNRKRASASKKADK